MNDWYELADDISALKKMAIKGILDFDAATSAVNKLVKKYATEAVE